MFSLLCKEVGPKLSLFCKTVTEPLRRNRGSRPPSTRSHVGHIPLVLYFRPMPYLPDPTPQWKMNRQAREERQSAVISAVFVAHDVLVVHLVALDLLEARVPRKTRHVLDMPPLLVEIFTHQDHGFRSAALSFPFLETIFLLNKMSFVISKKKSHKINK